MARSAVRPATSRLRRLCSRSAARMALSGLRMPYTQRAFASGKPALVNVLTDPSVVYPRKANLA